MKPIDDMLELSGSIESLQDDSIEKRRRFLSAIADKETNLDTPEKDMIFSLRNYMSYSYEAYRRTRDRHLEQHAPA